MSEIQRKQSNARMSQIVIHQGVAYLSGQVQSQLAAGSPSIEEQTRDVLAQIDALLAKAGTDRSKLLTAQILLADIAEFDRMNRVWEGWIDAENPPARTTHGARLAHPNVRVEITVSAAV
ncbi:MAG TPA: RidA family protein [Nevskiaceae bacterium]